MYGWGKRRDGCERGETGAWRDQGKRWGAGREVGGGERGRERGGRDGEEREGWSREMGGRGRVTERRKERERVGILRDRSTEETGEGEKKVRRKSSGIMLSGWIHDTRILY